MTDLGKMGRLGQDSQRLEAGAGGRPLPLACWGLSRSALVLRTLRQHQPLSCCLFQMNKRMRAWRPWAR